MAVAVEMPKLGNTVEECLICQVAQGRGPDGRLPAKPWSRLRPTRQVLKSTAPVDGTVLATFFEQGALVPVFTKLFVIGNPGESVEAFRPQAKGSTPAADAAALPGRQVREDAHPGASQLRAAEADAAVLHSSAPWSPRARRFAEEHNFHPQAVDRIRAGWPRSGSRSARALPQLAESLDAAGRRVRNGACSSAARVRASAEWFSPPIWVRQKAASPVFARRSRAACASRWPAPRSTRSILRPTPAGCCCCAPASRLRRGVPDININDLVTFCTVQALLEVPASECAVHRRNDSTEPRRAHRVCLRHSARIAGSGGARCAGADAWRRWPPV